MTIAAKYHVAVILLCLTAVLDLLYYYTCYQKWFQMTDLFSSGLYSNSTVIAKGKAAKFFVKFC